MPKIKLDAHLYERVKMIAQTAGYSNVKELILHAIEKEIALHETAAAHTPQSLKEQLSGLGYIE